MADYERGPVWLESDTYTFEEVPSAWSGRYMSQLALGNGYMSQGELTRSLVLPKGPDAYYESVVSSAIKISDEQGDYPGIHGIVYWDASPEKGSTERLTLPQAQERAAARERVGPALIALASRISRDIETGQDYGSNWGDILITTSVNWSYDTGYCVVEDPREADTEIPGLESTIAAKLYDYNFRRLEALVRTHTQRASEAHINVRHAVDPQAVGLVVVSLFKWVSDALAVRDAN